MTSKNVVNCCFYTSDDQEALFQDAGFTTTTSSSGLFSSYDSYSFVNDQEVVLKFEGDTGGNQAHGYICETTVNEYYDYYHYYYQET